MMKAYNNAVKRWAIKLTLNGKLTAQEEWRIMTWTVNTTQNTRSIDNMLEEIYLMACDMSTKITNRFLSDRETIEKPMTRQFVGKF